MLAKPIPCLHYLLSSASKNQVLTLGFGTIQVELNRMHLPSINTLVKIIKTRLLADIFGK
jgi:hypothetical protein